MWRCRSPGAERGCAEGNPGKLSGAAGSSGPWAQGRAGPSKARVSVSLRPGLPQRPATPGPPGHTGSGSTSPEAGHSEVKSGAALPVSPTPFDVLRGHRLQRPSPAPPPLLQLSAGLQFSATEWAQKHVVQASGPQGPENSGQRGWELPGLGPPAGATVKVNSG